ncbi:MAG: cytochrome c-type biogenesis protein [Acidimicrobiales bacterium]
MSGAPGARAVRWLPWLALLVVLGVALAAGSGGDGGPPSAAARTTKLASDVRCPTCEGLSAAESESPASLAVRQEIRRRVDAGQSDDEIRAYLVSRYGRDIVLTPAGSGVAALVWALPVAAAVLGAGGLVLAFRRRRAGPQRVPTEDDRRLVERARHA